MLSLAPTRKTAVAYYRHSAEDKQENSVPIQRDHAIKFAGQYEIDIIHEEADEGKSGLIANRPGFDRLFNEWVLNETAPKFDYVLVYDVSRWGRFQDPDEAAYYEMLCKKRGIKVIYISRGFPKEEYQLLNTLQTPIERYMAAEYSRQLSDKVWHGSMKVAEQGYSAGGTAPYGMTRVLLDESKNFIQFLAKGERKVIDNQRVTFAPANDTSSRTVGDIFLLLVENWFTPNEIAQFLNDNEISSANGSQWTREKVVRILTNETYLGTHIYNKTWGRLKQKRRPNPRSEWVVHPHAFDAIVEENVFRKAQENLYWLIPSKWKRGIYTKHKVHRFIRQHLEELLVQQEVHEDTRSLVLKKLPIIFGVTFFRESVSHWCFLIPEEMRQYDEVIAITIDLYRREPIDKFFTIPTNAFGLSNFLAFDENSAFYQSFCIKAEKAESKLQELCKVVELTGR